MRTRLLKSRPTLHRWRISLHRPSLRILSAQAGGRRRPPRHPRLDRAQCEFRLPFPHRGVVRTFVLSVRDYSRPGHVHHGALSRRRRRAAGSAPAARAARLGRPHPGIEQADNYGRNNFLAVYRPLQGWLMEDDKGASTAVQAKWSTVSVTTNGLAENVFANYLSTTLLAGGIWLRGGAGTATNYACDGFGAVSRRQRDRDAVLQNWL